MTALTTNSDLLDGVGEFIKVAEHDLLSLLPQEDRDQGLSGAALTPYHNSAWARVVNDFLHEADFDLEDSDLTEDQQTVLKAASCNRLMADLYRRAACGDVESPLSKRADWFEDEYDRIKGRWAITMPSGRTSPIGETIVISRG